MTREELAFMLRGLVRNPNPRALRAAIRSTPAADFVDALEQVPNPDVIRLLGVLEPAELAPVFTYFDPDRQDELLAALPIERAARLVEELPADDRADLVARAPEALRTQLLAALDAVEREDILKLSAYPEGSVGSVTTSDFVAVRADETVDQVLARLRAGVEGAETIYVLYVLDPERRLLGTVSLRKLVLAAPDATMASIMREQPVFVRADWPRSQAAELIRRHDLLAVPVLDGNDRMLGIVTVDDAMDVEKEADTAQLARFGGTGTLGGPDLDVIASPFRDLFRVRVFWLAMLTFFGILTSTFVAEQEEILSQVIVLAAFIAPIVDMGGNTGSQSATLVIRAMALGELTLSWRDVWFVIKRELPVAFALGVTIAILEAILAYFSKGVGWEVLMVVGLAMLACTALGGIIGALLPFAARRIGTDPATLSSPLITSIMDLLGVFIYFGLAYAFLGHLLAD
jgi:magnesium transporter